MPSYKNYVAKEDINKWNDAFLNNLKATGYIPRADNKVPMGDLSLYPHILQYEETIFFKFDDNVLIPANVIKLLPKKEYISFEVYDKFVKINLDGYYIIYQKMNEKFPDYKSVIPQQFTSTLKFDVSKIEWCKHEYVSEFMTFTQKGNTLHVESLDINTDRKYVQDIPNTNEDLEFKVVIKNFKICVEGLKEVEIKMYKHLILINGNILCDTLIND